MQTNAPDIDTRCIMRFRADIAATLGRLDPPARVRFAEDICEATGGWMIPPRACGEWGSHWAELDMLGVSATGDDDAGAIAQWMKAVARMDAA